MFGLHGGLRNSIMDHFVLTFISTGETGGLMQQHAIIGGTESPGQDSVQIWDGPDVQADMTLATWRNLDTDSDARAHSHVARVLLATKGTVSATCNRMPSIRLDTRHKHTASLRAPSRLCICAMCRHQGVCDACYPDSACGGMLLSLSCRCVCIYLHKVCSCLLLLAARPPEQASALSAALPAWGMIVLIHSLIVHF